MFTLYSSNSVSVTMAYGLSYNSKFEKWRDDERILFADTNCSCV